MRSLPTQLRRQLESAVKRARKIAEGGARHALEALAVHEPDSYQHMDEATGDLRLRLCAQAKQVGDGESKTRRGAYEIKHLVEKLAYDQWHRLLFARYLLENDLLISPEHGVAVSMDDCEELAPSLGLKDAWAVAARFAAKELPEIFRSDDPAGAVELPVEDRNPLIQLVTGLPVEVFTATDSLGWCYQFWQAERKEEVNASGNKIGADELPAVTQLFTEDYMVDFLLDNTLGAWHAGKVFAANRSLAKTAKNEEELRRAIALPGCPWVYLRFIQDKDASWTPAAGTFDSWPKTAKELTCLDPCMGSGHFLVGMFDRLVALRSAEEKLDAAASVAAVIRDNLFGLEIDPRCTQIGAFNLALAAWRLVGHCTLPAMNIACSGLAPNTNEAEWLAIAGDNEKLKNGMARLYRLFENAPVLGSLINPRTVEGDLLEAGYHELQPLLEMALAQKSDDDPAHEMTVTARGLAKAAEILAGQFTLVATNVPYLARGKQGVPLQQYSDKFAPNGKMDLATVFLQRCRGLLGRRAVTAVVTPQNWLFLTGYTEMRLDLLRTMSWLAVGRLGPGAFETISGEVVNTSLLIFGGEPPSKENAFLALDVSADQPTSEKARTLRDGNVQMFRQSEQIKNPDYRIVLTALAKGAPLRQFATALSGCSAGDGPRFIRLFWEIPRNATEWEFHQSSVPVTCDYGGKSEVIFWERERGEMFQLAERVKHLNHAAQNWLRGKPNWKREGVVVSQMGDLPVTGYLGDIYDCNCCAIVPNSAAHLPALWAFCVSGAFSVEVRKINQKLNVTPGTLLDVPFDLAYWQKVAAEKYPHGLPKPFSSDPTQWLFSGHPKNSDQPLHVALARVLGYHWPRQTGSNFPDCPALGPEGLEKLADGDGITCLSATKGEAPATERLRAFLVQALGKVDLSALIASAGPKGSRSETLEEWLRDEFFEQHCALFHHRPFIWHIWDGHKGGFSALVNYHQLTHANLEKLTYAYLGDWIRRQQAAVEAGEAGSDARLQAAKQLQVRLKLILEGEPPYDLFVRWKPLSKQAIGWHPEDRKSVV